MCARRCASPLFRGGGALLPTAANVQPGRLALGLRAKVIASGVRAPRAHAGREARRATGLSARPPATPCGGRGRPRRQQRHRLVRRLPPRARGRVEPHGDHRARPRGDRGARLERRRVDLRLPHAAPLPPHDARRPDRFRLGRRANGVRRPPHLRSRPRPEGGRTAKRDLLQMFPQLHGRRITHAWGGPIDVSPTHLPIFGSRGASTTASASPATASARRSSAARSWPGSRSTGGTTSPGSRSSIPTGS